MSFPWYVCECSSVRACVCVYVLMSGFLKNYRCRCRRRCYRTLATYSEHLNVHFVCEWRRLHIHTHTSASIQSRVHTVSLSLSHSQPFAAVFSSSSSSCSCVFFPSFRSIRSHSLSQHSAVCFSCISTGILIFVTDQRE